MCRINNAHLGGQWLKTFLIWASLVLANYAQAVVQFQTEVLDIPALRGSTFEFITIEGDTTTVEVDENGVIVLPEEVSLDLVRGGALQVGPINGRPAFTATVPMDWNGVAPLVLQLHTQSFRPHPDVSLRAPALEGSQTQGSVDLRLDNRPLYYIHRRLTAIRGLAEDLGFPQYALDANEITLRRWYIQFWLRFVTARMAARRDDLDIASTFFTMQFLMGVVAITNPNFDTSGLQPDLCRTVNAESQVLNETPIAVARMTAEDIRLSGHVTNRLSGPSQGTRVLATQVMNPFLSSEPVWRPSDAQPPVVDSVDSNGVYQLRFPLPTPIESTNQEFQPAENVTREEHPILLMSANGCDRGRPVGLNINYVFE
jgi:hypothetical protein